MESVGAVEISIAKNVLIIHECEADSMQNILLTTLNVDVWVTLAKES